ncbi:zinc-dependent metalloprotease [Sphingobacterium lumbrici]|uniref:zinc-dependent metalloprotease n=1 Tax=Sphingobacterium lumbrici TaxID=2559600 RepID=UPI00112A6077|nr:zinc-dependent metalloprotease [Sphingobacterium lumbrici]
MRLKLVLLILIGCSCAMSYAQSKEQQSSTTTDTLKKVDPLKAIITDKTETKEGLFTVHKTGERYYFEIPDSLLNRTLLLTNFLVKVPSGSPKYGGEQMDQKMILFDKGIGKKINLRIVSTGTTVDPSSTLAQSVQNSNVNVIATIFDLKARGKEDNSSIIDVTDFLQKENVFTRLSTEVTKRLGLGAMAADRSYLKGVSVYPINLEMKSVRTYAATAPARPSAMEPVLEAAKVGNAITLEVSTSILLMPEKPMIPREFDLRVGYFAGGYSPLQDDQQTSNFRSFIVRYRLEPKDEDLEKYKQGILVEPKQQIVYYIDPATPKQWRPYLIEGINDWNVAFEAAGFKNAIIGKEWPEGDTTMSLEDARYKVLRYFPSEVANAYGPNIHDPRSGEILQGYIGWYHNVMTLVHDWYMLQAGANDERARTMKFSDELMGQLIRFVSSHEVGHTLGLRHNMGASSQTPVEKLRDKEWVEKNGHSVSIMDYARFNYVAQPEDGIGEAGIMPRINDYDKWAIQWGYKYTGAKDVDEDKKIVSKWIVDSLAANPKLWFGGEGLNHDCRCQTEDVGDNSMEASTYGIKNLKFVLKHLPDWTMDDEDDLYRNLTQMYVQLLNQYNRYVMHVLNNIASVYETIKEPSQEGDIYSSAPLEKQREAVAFLNREVFETPNWLLDNEILNKIGNPIRSSSIKIIQTRQMSAIFSDRVLNTLYIMQERFGADSTYSVQGLLHDMKAGVWSELKTHKPMDGFRRDVQKSYVNALLRAMKEAEVGGNIIGILMSSQAAEETPVTTNSDVGALIAVHLEDLRKEILASKNSLVDKESRDHLDYMAGYIQRALNKRFNKK